MKGVLPGTALGVLSESADASKCGKFGSHGRPRTFSASENDNKI